MPGAFLTPSPPQTTLRLAPKPVGAWMMSVCTEASPPVSRFSIPQPWLLLPPRYSLLAAPRALPPSVSSSSPAPSVNPLGPSAPLSLSPLPLPHPTVLASLRPRVNSTVKHLGPLVHSRCPRQPSPTSPSSSLATLTCSFTPEQTRGRHLLTLIKLPLN